MQTKESLDTYMKEDNSEWSGVLYIRAASNLTDEKGHGETDCQTHYEGHMGQTERYKLGQKSYEFEEKMAV